MIGKIFKEEKLFLIGGLLYYLIEMLYRGYSHWTMFLLGGVCFILIGGVNEYIPWKMPLWQQGIIGSLIITAGELIVGYIVNIRLGWQIWNYSDIPFNFMGQICLPFSLLWIAVSLAAIVLDDYLRYWLFDEEKPHYRLFK